MSSIWKVVDMQSLYFRISTQLRLNSNTANVPASKIFGFSRGKIPGSQSLI